MEESLRHETLLRDEETAQPVIPEDDQRLLRADSIRIQRRGPSDINYWVRINNAYWNLNIKLLLNTFSSLTLYGLMIVYYQTGEHKWLYLSCLVDMLCHAVSICFIKKYSIFFGIVDLQALDNALDSEFFIMVTKILLMVILALSETMTKAFIGWIGSFFILLILWRGCLSMHKTAYDSIFSFVNSVTLALLLLKHHQPGLGITWSGVFFLQKVAAWVCFVAMGFYTLFWLLVILFKLCMPEVSWVQIFFNLVFVASVVFYSLEVFALQGFIENYTPWIGLNLLECSIACLISFFIHAVLAFLLGDSPMFQLDTSEKRLEEKKGLNYAVHLVQISPTLFVGQSMGETQAPRYQLSDTDLCFICYTNQPNCVMSPCLHGGLCKPCASEWMKKKQTCSQCRRKVDKIMVIEKKTEEEYIVTSEITAA